MLMIQAEELGKELVTGLFPITKKNEQAKLENKGKVVPYKRDAPKVGRNDPCPCGSGKKYKKCCLNKTSAH